MVRPAAEVARASRLRTVIVAVLVAAAGLAVGGGLVVLAGVAIGSLGVDLDLEWAIVLAVALSQVGFAITAIGFLVLSGRGVAYLEAHVPTGRDIAWLVGGYLLALSAAIVGSILVTLASAPTASNEVAELGLERPATLLLLVPLSFLFIGPGEEILFRGTVQSLLGEAFGPWAAVVIASALFAVLHVVALTGSVRGQLVAVALLFLPSLVLGVAYERTHNLVVCAGIHGAYDATLFGLLYVAVRYGSGVA